MGCPSSKVPGRSHHLWRCPLEKEIIGILSGIIVSLSVVPYSIRTWQGKAQPNPTSWSLWTLIGLSLLVTYEGAGANHNVWPAVFGFTNPLIITFLLLKNRERWKKFEAYEVLCLIFGILSLAMWWYLRGNESLVQYALYVAILADACAAIPTIAFVWRSPQEERPFAWGLFGVGYGLAIFAISKHTVANYVLPLYMFFGSWTITLPLILYRAKVRAPLAEWY